MLSDDIDFILGNDWLVQHKARLDFQSKCCVFGKGCCKMIVCEPNAKLES